MAFMDDDADDMNQPEEGQPERPFEELEHKPDRGEIVPREVKVVGLVEDAPQQWVVVLRDSQERQLPILIGPFEAHSIALAVQGERITPRPMTHDLLKNTIERLGARVERLMIDDLWNETYYAKISLIQGDHIIEVDTRPSDGIALALRAGAPIYVAESVLEEAAKAPTEEEPPEDDLE